MKNNDLVISIIVGSVIIAVSLIILGGRINNSYADTTNYPYPDVITVDDFGNSQTYLYGYEASRYLKMTYESFMSAIYNGEYTGPYVTEKLNDGTIEYIFPKASLDEWFMEYANEHKEFKMDPSYFHKEEGGNL